MKEKVRPILIVFLLVIFQSMVYLLAKLSPFNVHLIGNTLDSKIPFISLFIYFYISWYIMLFLLPMLFYDEDKSVFKKYIYSVVVSIVISFVFYFFFPTTILRPTIINNSITNYLINFIYLIDTPALNCFPSMHCLITFINIYMILSTKYSKFKKFSLIIWCVLIILSTLFIKQHVLLDVLSAFIISIVVYLPISKLKM